jgi:hypothetical protein
MFILYKTPLEAAMLTDTSFLLVIGIISFGINLGYACMGNGASCSSLALALGLSTFSVAMHRRSMINSNSSPLCLTITVFVLGCTPVFPFDSLMMLTLAVVIGMIVGLALFVEDPGRTSDPGDMYHNESMASEEPTKSPAWRIRWKFAQGIGVLYSVLYLLLIFHVPSPDKLNLYPYLTGCNLVYSDQIGDLISAYTSANNGRALEGSDGEDWFDGQSMCAQMCLPHLVYRPALWGVEKFASVPLERGTCEDNGYVTHVADKTFSEFTVVFEVQLFTASDDDN